MRRAWGGGWARPYLGLLLGHAVEDVVEDARLEERDANLHRLLPAAHLMLREQVVD